MSKKLVKILILLFINVSLLAQELLTIDNAIKMGLEKNYSVLIAKNNKEIAKFQNNLGNAGLSPSVTLNGSLNYANVNSHQEFATGVIQDRAGAASNNLGSSVNGFWTVFDGLKMFAIKKRLDLNEQLTTLQLKQQMENTIYNIILGYYDIIRINELIRAGNQNLSIYDERKKISQMRLEIGSDSKVAFLLTQSDLNKAKSDLIQLELQLITAKANLNSLLIRSADTDFKTSDSIVSTYNPSVEELKKSSLNNNSGILISKQSELIVNQTIYEARSANLPLIQLNGSYNFNRNQSQAGIVFLSQQAGLNGGLSASWLIFNGNKNRRLVQERQINLLNQKYATEQTRQTVDAIVYINYQSYLTNKKIQDLEQENLKNSQEILNVSMERYKVGKSNFLETQLTQKNLEDAQNRYFNALYNTKKAETELLRANGALVK
jgi:outer membrane protein